MIKDYIIIGQELGEGHFGHAYKVQKKNTGDIYVIKQIPLKKLKNQKELNLVNQEAKILSLIESDFVVKYYDYFEENNAINIVMEYCEGGDLSHYLERRGSNKFLDEDLIWQLFIKITIGLADIHKKKILHRDIKTLNIFLKENMEIKIGDLGIAKILTDSSYATSYVGTAKYCSPEVLGHKPYNYKSDVWSLGCVLYELCTLIHPFEEKDQGLIIQRIINYNPAPINGFYSNDLNDVVFWLLNKNPECRPNCSQLLNNEIVFNKAKSLGLDKYIIKLNDYSMNIKANEYLNLNMYKGFIRSNSNNNNNQNIIKFGSSINDFIFLRDIKYENNSIVKMMQSKLNGLYYAIKIIPKNALFLNDKNIYREKILQKIMNNKNIVKLYDSFEDNDNLYLVFEYVHNIDLQNKILKHMETTTESIKEKIIIKIFKEILNGLEYLHSINVIHRYLSPENILFDDFNHIKISGFSLSAFLKPEWEKLPIDPKLCSNNTYIFNKDYMAPEIINRQRYDFKSDIYSLGLIIFNLMTFSLPFFTLITSENTISRLGLKCYISNEYSIGLKNLVYKMISENPNDRPTAKEVRQSLSEIEQNPINYNFNNYMNNPYDISSFISVITCLCEIDELGFGILKNMIIQKYKNNNEETLESFLPFNIIKMREIIEQNKKNKLNNYPESHGIKKIDFDKNFYSFKNLLSSKSKKINSMGISDPIIVLQELIINYSKEFKEHISYHNSLLLNYFFIKDNFPYILKAEIEQTIQNFQLNYISPFVDIFYFIDINMRKCTLCDSIINLNKNILFSISIKAEMNQQLSDLIANNFKKIMANDTCPICNSLLKEQRFFLNSPQYLIIEFENRNNILLDDTIDLTPFILTNVGPREYDFFAVIMEEKILNKNHYILSVKKEIDNYLFYSDNNCQKGGDEVKKCGNHCIAIYKGRKVF